MDPHEIIVSGFGGQGIMVVGGVLAYSGLFENRRVTLVPSYGPEVRGGAAHCSVVISGEDIASPVVSRPTEVIAMNQVAVNRFVDRVIPGGTLLLNSSMVETIPRRDDIRVFSIPASEIAAELGDLRVSNMVILGVLVEACKPVTFGSVSRALETVIPSKYHSSIPINLEAIRRGQLLARKAAHQ